jgi:predicted RNA-binding protein with PUA-like domain
MPALFQHTSFRLSAPVGAALAALTTLSQYFVCAVQVRELKRQITLEELKSHKAGALSSMALFTTARLSVQPVSQTEWDFVLSLEEN